jgi:hypothetical protein
MKQKIERAGFTYKLALFLGKILGIGVTILLCLLTVFGITKVLGWF